MVARICRVGESGLYEKRLAFTRKRLPAKGFRRGEEGERELNIHGAVMNLLGE